MISLRASINAKCKDCIYDPKSGQGTWREQVAGCLSPNCALYPVRPMPDIKRRPKTGQEGCTANNEIETEGQGHD
jgi:hypothetical protein